VSLYTPAIDVDGEEFVVADAPMLALADELSQPGKHDMLGGDGHLLIAIALEEIPLAMVL